MANWKHTLNIADIHDKYEEDEDIESCAKAIAKRIEQLPPSISNDLIIKAIVDEFRRVQTVAQYDYVLGRLYDWGDLGHRLWINTFTI